VNSFQLRLCVNNDNLYQMNHWNFAFEYWELWEYVLNLSGFSFERTNLLPSAQKHVCCSILLLLFFIILMIVLHAPTRPPLTLLFCIKISSQKTFKFIEEPLQPRACLIFHQIQSNGSEIFWCDRVILWNNSWNYWMYLRWLVVIIWFILLLF